MKKTNVMRLLDSKDIWYEPYSYEIEDDKLDGISVAGKIGKDVEDVYKTLVCKNEGRDYFVFIIPVAEELDLKLAARSVGEKSIDMINVKDINKLTGYERGGCSPIGMKRELKTFLPKKAEDKESIIVSAGQIGSQVEIRPKDLKEFVELEFIEL